MVMSALLTSLIFALLCYAMVGLIWNKKFRNLPPGPPQTPLLGNLMDIPRKRPWRKFAEWKSLYGDTVSFTVFGRKLVVLNSYQTAVDLFEKRSVIYSHRAKRTMARLCGLDRAILFQDYDESTRRSRKLILTEFSPQGVIKHQALLEQEARLFCKQIQDVQKDDFNDHIRTCVNRIMLMSTYGHKVTREDDLIITLAKEIMGYLADVITPNKFLVDAIPALALLPKWFPGCDFHQTAQRCRELSDQFTRLSFAEVAKHLEIGQAYPSFVSNRISLFGSNVPEDEMETIKWTAAGIHGGGTDTAVSIFGSFFLAMCLHPEVQNKAQEELDTVLGRDTLPTFADKARLPYIECIMKEILRWNPATPLVGHCSLVDDEYNGWFFPARSVVIANIWSFCHDETIYPRPRVFDPDRFMPGKNGKINPDPRAFAFGFGRRSCPGSNLADLLMFMIISTTLSSCNISADADTVTALGDVFDLDYSTGAISHPPPFKCQIEKRSENLAKLLLFVAESM